MQPADNLSLVLRCGLVGLFLVYFVIALVLTVRLADSPIRRLILRGAFIPVVMVGIICGSLRWFQRAEGHAVLTAFAVVVSCSVLGAVAFSLWLERFGGKEMLYVPIAFKRFGWSETEQVTFAVSDLSSDDPQFGSDLLLSYLPLALIVLALALTLWDISRGVGA